MKEMCEVCEACAGKRESGVRVRRPCGTTVISEYLRLSVRQEEPGPAPLSVCTCVALCLCCSC
jgi:hypothetical protein